MLRTTAFAAAVIVGASPAGATEADTQFWASASARVPLAEGAWATLDGSERVRGAAAGGDQQLVRATVEFDAAQWLILGGGVAYVESGTDETRLFQSLTLRTGNLALRSQLEERFFQGAARPQLRGRQRVMWTRPLDDNDRLLASAELNYILRDQVPGLDDRIDQWRFRLDWRHRLSPQVELTAAYMAMIAPRQNAPDRLSHVPMLALAYSF